MLVKLNFIDGRKDITVNAEIEMKQGRKGLIFSPELAFLRKCLKRITEKAPQGIGKGEIARISGMNTTSCEYMQDMAEITLICEWREKRTEADISQIINNLIINPLIRDINERYSNNAMLLKLSAKTKEDRTAKDRLAVIFYGGIITPQFDIEIRENHETFYDGFTRHKILTGRTLRANCGMDASKAETCKIEELGEKIKLLPDAAQMILLMPSYENRGINFNLNDGITQTP